MFEHTSTQETDAQLRLPTNLERLSTAAVDACKFGPGFVRPAYENFCFSRLPGFFEHTLLGSTERANFPQAVLSAIERFDHIIFVFVDAFGWQTFERFRDSAPFLREVDRHGAVLKTTSQFPSTTATHVTTAFTGLAAYEHEICGFDYFEPRVGRMIRPLRFAFSDENPDSLRTAGYSPAEVLPDSLMIPRLRSNDVMLRFFGPEAFFPSSFNSNYAPSEVLQGFDSFSHGIERARFMVGGSPRTSYQSVYTETYDSTCHKWGVAADQSDQAARDILRALERFLQWSGLPRTLLVISADHGHISDIQGGGIPINKVVPDITSMLKRDVRGSPIRFSGGLRHLCLHPRPECEQHLLGLLRERLAGAATVMTVPELEHAGLLGPGKVKDSFISRLGTIGILPHAGYSVYWDEAPRFTYGDRSHHGGASAQEMETPLLLLPLG
jgi:hypothetical protein